MSRIFIFLANFHCTIFSFFRPFLQESPIGVSELMMQKLIESGVEVILEDHVDVEFDYQLHDHEAELAEGEKPIPSALFFKSRTVCTRKGRKICADLVIPCLNGRPNTDALRAHFGEFVQESGHVDIRDTFQLPNTDTVFVAGDIVNREYFNLWVNLKDHAEIVFRNVCDIVRGKHAYATLSTRGINEYPEITCFGPEYAINTSKGCCGFFKGLATGTKAWALQKQSDLTMKPPPADLSGKK